MTESIETEAFEWNKARMFAWSKLYIATSYKPQKMAHL